ncbi:hypothetical protein PQO03_11525 [Lentisphaera profundi]|uniref:Uncharacterized protein n=1 Tax=Lentisphaera profundi TaxID=1658616 RepID=A0ABY7VUA5_9BACT|nr:hypothetical protein [Lentisphaera profundi]WDE96339.1 hypothetical protein PQO03_11525 [Lentisphaera profundi]
MATDQAIYVSTVADLNDHRLRVYIDESPDKSYERTFQKNLNITSGTLVVSAPANSGDDDLKINLNNGEYIITVCSNSIGKDVYTYDEDGEEMEDEEYFQHDEYEYYDVYINAK